MKSAAAAILMVVSLTTSLAGDEGLTSAQQELVDAERAFVRLAAERGFRDSFFTYFADDGIAFNPHPFKVRASLANQPSSGGPMGAAWAPVYGDIAAAGDLGWNTGPLVFEGEVGKPDRYGMFFSVWKRQPDGTWRVVLDVGSDTPAPVVPLDAPFQLSHRSTANARANVEVAAEIDGLLVIEREFLATAASESAGRAYGSRLSDEARVHRPGVMPFVGKEALGGWANRQLGKLRGEPLAADVSRSGDLGYAYGRYELDTSTPEAGYYVRVWKRDSKGDWRIVMDTISPLPAGVKPLTAELQRAEEFYFAGRWAEAAAAYQHEVEEHPDNVFALNRLGTTQIQLKRYPEAIRNLEQGVRIGGGTKADFYNLACAYALSGDSGKALNYVGRAIDAGVTNRTQFESDGDLQSLRELPRFKELMQRLE
ncbi:MAG: TPR end-of-group domain-containing protein [Steroidobacteraceae bacterium]